MPKGFTDDERLQIHEDLIDKGMALFSELGFKKTSVSKLTQAVGIAKGSFYLFYETKEELFMDILEKVEAGIHDEILHEITTSSQSASALLKNIFKIQLKGIVENPIIRMTLEENLLPQIWSKLPKQRQQENIERDTLFLKRFLEARPEAQVMFRYSPETLAGIFRAMVFVVLYKAEVGASVYEEVLEFVVDASVDKLFDKQSR